MKLNISSIFLIALFTFALCTESTGAEPCQVEDDELAFSVGEAKDFGSLRIRLSDQGKEGENLYSVFDLKAPNFPVHRVKMYNDDQEIFRICGKEVTIVFRTGTDYNGQVVAILRVSTF